METFIVKWYGPYSLDRSNFCDVAYEKGIYMVTRKWGNAQESLQYIGRTTRSLEQRIKEHNWWLSEMRGNLQIRYGIVEIQPGQRFSGKRLADIEALLIIWHKPKENTVNYDWYYGRELTVINKGRYGPLKREVTTLDLEYVD